MSTLQAQRMESLKLANETRVYAAARKREVAQGLLSFRSLLEDPRCGSIPIAAALTAIPGVGPTKASWVLNRARILPAARLGSLTARQREAVLGYLHHFPKHANV